MTITIDGTSIGIAASGADVEVSADQYAQALLIEALIKRINQLIGALRR